MINNMHKIIRVIGEALHASNNTVTTDIVEVKPDETHWVVDNSKAILALNDIDNFLTNNKNTCPLCGHCNKYP